MTIQLCQQAIIKIYYNLMVMYFCVFPFLSKNILPVLKENSMENTHIAECPFCMNNICFEFLAVQWSFFYTAYQKRQIYMQANEN